MTKSIVKQKGDRANDLTLKNWKKKQTLMCTWYDCHKSKQLWMIDNLKLL